MLLLSEICFQIRYTLVWKRNSQKIVRVKNLLIQCLLQQECALHGHLLANLVDTVKKTECTVNHTYNNIYGYCNFDCHTRILMRLQLFAKVPVGSLVHVVPSYQQMASDLFFTATDIFLLYIFTHPCATPPPLLPPTGTFIHQIKTQIGSCISFVWAHISHSPFLCSQTRKRARRVAVNPSNPHMVRLFSHRNITAAAIKCTSIRAILHFYPETFFVQHFYTFL